MLWVLRIAVAGEFFGHGIFALQQKQSWIKYFEAVNLSPDTAMTIMPLIGIMDIALAVLILIKPVRVALLWMTFWGFWTALLRPIAGEPIWDFIERWANWGAPLAILLYIGWPKSFKELWK
ncbi:hypothetical protein C4553_03695 [Candidatus Parcubacteria bacterium]|nr:MAG: hypothetical protein C4553_03695 [Candidatus Parcubacteria bacterium]